MLEIQQKDNMEQHTELLKKCILFNNIEEKEIPSLIKCLGGQYKHYKKNENIFFEDKIYSQCGILISGELQIIQYDFTGNRTILSEIEPFQLFGEAYSIKESKFPMTVTAVKDSIVLLIKTKNISTPCKHNCKFHITLINNFLKILAAKNIKQNIKIQCLSKRTTREKILNYLQIQKQKSKTDTFEIPFDRQSLADYLCVERSAMSAEISKLCKEGIIETKKNKFKIL